MKNKVMLITYPDSIGKNIKDLEYILDNNFKDIISAVHLLPFYPSSGDRGFAPLCYDEIGESFGTYQDIKRLGSKYTLMVDFMINHISKESKYYKDFQQNKDNSKYKDFFIRYKDFWTNENPSDKQIDTIYKRKDKEPSTKIKFADGTKEKLWCTFSDEQIDLNIKNEVVEKFIVGNLNFLMSNNAKIIRFDAFAYAIKKEDTSCFFIEPEIWETLNKYKKVLEKNKTILLPEIHEHYKIHKKIESEGYHTYDFALPFLLLHSIYSLDNTKLINWLEICPREQFTTLDTHDGIGVVDVADLLTQNEIDQTIESLYKYGANVKRKYSSSEYNNLDIYQINCTYYSALGENDNKYLLARAVQMFAPGTPQIYYVGLFSGKNDLKLLEETKEGRNINRHYYSIDEIKLEFERDVNKRLFKLLKFRNNYPVFDGEYEVVTKSKSEFEIKYSKDELCAKLTVDLKDMNYKIMYVKDGLEKEL